MQVPPTPTGEYTVPGTPTDRSLASTNLSISGRNTEMSYDGGDVFTMMIKQDSRDSNVYDAPTFIPDIQGARESPDGAYSYVIDGRCPMSSMSNISDLKHDYEDEACSSEGPERDILMEFVMMEERQEERRKGPSPFRVG